MGGICGIFNIYNDRHPDMGVVEAVLAKMGHRGPDGAGTLALPGAALGWCSLDINGPEGGARHFTGESGAVTAVTAGEIFNSTELMRKLELRGHRFKSRGDTEAVPHLYEEYGAAFPKLLNGQFAAAVFDGERDELVLVRDQAGIAPLFYTEWDGRLIFASEIKAILEYPGVQRRLNLPAVDQLIHFPGVLSPDTFFRGIYSLPAGHILRVRRGMPPEELVYWDLLFPSGEPEDMGEAFYVERFRELFKKSISRRLHGEAPVGLYISGGLDSALVASVAAGFLPDAPLSFSARIGPGGELDESNYQEAVRDRIASLHASVNVAEADIWDNLRRVVYHAESGLKESYDVAAFLLSGLVRGSPAGAVLTGQGADELFCGYVGHMLDGFRSAQRPGFSPAERRMNGLLWGDPNFRYERNHPELMERSKSLYSEALRGELPRFSALRHSPIRLSRVRGLTAPRRRSYIDFKLRLSDHLLGEHGDRMFFAHSVEGRHPFLDPEIIAFAAGLPDKYKLNGACEKYILKKAGKGIVPGAVLRRRKFPFQAPGMASLIKAGAPGMEFLSRDVIKKYGIFDPGFIESLCEVYSRPDFKLMGAYETDLLMIALTVTMLCEEFGLSL